MSYNILIENAENVQQYAEMVRVFLPAEAFQITADPAEAATWDKVDQRLKEFGDKNQVRRMLYMMLSQETGITPPWGILTGVRPVKKFGEMMDAYGPKRAAMILETEYFLSREKIELLEQLVKRQRHTFGRPPEDSTGIYIGIPFCSTRCLYCSFASNQVEEEEVQRYLPFLLKEIDAGAALLEESGYRGESVYIGGGTPTTLTADQLDQLLTLVNEKFGGAGKRGSRLRELTVEAGRPDTITREKLQVLQNHDVTRISINPQTMQQKTLDKIGRDHTVDDIVRVFHMAREVGIRDINMDLIAGLPEETKEDFVDTLDKILALEPDNITIHCLAVKRASKLHQVDENYHYKQGAIAVEMLETASQLLPEMGYEPYYLYRQKNMAGALENIGYTKGGCDSCYNVRIMDEHQTICAFGAGGVSKVYYPEENRLERVANVTNYQQYIDRIDEMIQRKQKNWNRRK